MNDLSSPERIQSDLNRYGFLVNEPVGAETCARCHQEIVNQWAESAHRFSSFNNPFYKASIDNLRTEPNGHQRSQWCAACHDPVLLFTNKMLDKIDPHWPESQAGLTCLACHAIDAIHGKAGNGNYNLMDETPSPYLFALTKSGPGRLVHDSLVKSKPAAHKQQMLKPFHKFSEFCLTCHKVSLDESINHYRWLRGQNEYDAWHDSGVARNASRTFYLPPNTRQCQDCHMPLEEVQTFDVSAKNGRIKSHRFLSVNTALPYIRGDHKTVERIEKYLQDGKMRIGIFAMRRPDETNPIVISESSRTLYTNEEIQLDVVVRNKNVGHTFPGGTNDSNQAWIEFRVFDENGHTYYVSGAIDERGTIDPNAHFYKVIFVDKNSQPAMKRDPQNFHTTAYARVIGPGTANVVRYHIQVPGELEGQKLTVSAKLFWRKFNRQYTKFVFAKEPVPKLPQFDDITIPELLVTLIAETSQQFTVTSGNNTQSQPLQQTQPGEWESCNDYGIAYFLQGDLRLADWAFGQVEKMAPERIDGPRNRARVAIREGRIEDAYRFLEQCETVKPGDPQTAWFWGEAKKEDGLYSDAVNAFRRVLAYFPEDRAAWREMGRAYYLGGQYQESLNAYLKALAIDPEDRTAHYHRMLCYRALGQEPEAAEAEKAYRFYQIDETAAQATQQFRLKNPEINRTSQPLQVYNLTRIDEDS